MSGRNLRLVALLAVAVVQLAVPAAMIYGHERTLAHGTQWRFRTAPVDPADAFRGRYLALGFAANQTPLPAGMELDRGDRVYVPLARDAEGFATLGPPALEPPEGGDWLRLRVAWVLAEETGRVVRLELPFDRLYLAEEVAPQAEAAYFAAQPPRAPGQEEAPVRPAWAVVRVRAGHAVLEDLVVDGVPIRELVTRSGR